MHRASRRGHREPFAGSAHAPLSVGACGALTRVAIARPQWERRWRGQLRSLVADDRLALKRWREELAPGKRHRLGECSGMFLIADRAIGHDSD
jgi:hypothetical protein